MSVYIHGTDDDEQRRLSLMNDVLLNSAMLRETHLRGDERILDLGSGLGQFTRMMARAVPNGQVVGIEYNAEQLSAAKRIAANDGESNLAEFRSGDALNLDLGDEWGTFDVAHTRFLLEHIPDPLRAVTSMVRAVKPGGRIVLADDDHGVLRLWPEPPGWMNLWDAYMQAYERIGNDPFVGRRLVQLLHEAGAQPVRNTWVFFGGCAGMETFPILAANMAGVVRTARDTIIAERLFDADAFDRVMADYRAWSQRPDAALWFSVAWAEGRVKHPRVPLPASFSGEREDTQRSGVRVRGGAETAGRASPAPSSAFGTFSPGKKTPGEKDSRCQTRASFPLPLRHAPCTFQPLQCRHLPVSPRRSSIPPAAGFMSIRWP